MPVIHFIRLRGPWQLAPAAKPTQTLTATMPSTWAQAGFVGFRGGMLHTRRFGCPTGLEPGDRLMLCATGLVGTGSATLDGEPLGPVEGGGFRFDITARVRPRNSLTIDLTHDDDGGGLPGEVRLEVERD